MIKIRLAIVAAACCAATQALACYTVYDRENTIVYNAAEPPVDMSRPLHETVPAAFPGGHLVFNVGGECPKGNADPAMRAANRSGRSPLLTDPATAKRLGLPHAATLSAGIVIVPDRPDDMRPGMVVAESGLPNANDTRAMGAGPARSPTQAMGAGPAQPQPQPAQRRGNVITEMHNPPLTAIQPAPVNRSR